MHLGPLDIVVALLFLICVVTFALRKGRREQSSEAYFLAGRGLPWPVIGLSIVAANISTEQMVGMAGQGAGGVGLAVSAWQLTGSIGIVLIAFTLLPHFLRAGIYTMPEFLEYRYDATARGVMALLTVTIYVAVLITGVLYSGGVVLRTIFSLPLVTGVWSIGAIAAVYTSWGGLKAVAYADLLLGIALLAGGLFTFGLGLDAVGGWSAFQANNVDKLHMVLPAGDERLPWTGVLSGMWIVILYYCGLNQFIVQRNLAARTLRDGQLGMVFAGALWLIVPFAIVMPGIMAQQLYPEQLAKNADEAFPLLIRTLVPVGGRGFLFAAIAGAVVSSLASMLNSASTIATMDVYRRMLKKEATQENLVRLGRVLTVAFVVIGCSIAPALESPGFHGVFEYIQQFQGYIWPGVSAAFLIAFLVPRAPGSAGVAALLCGPAFYGLLQAFSSFHFLTQVLIAFLLCCAVMILITCCAPLERARSLPQRDDVELRNSPLAIGAGVLVIGAVMWFWVWFW